MAAFHIFRDSKNVLRGHPDFDFAHMGDQILFVNTTAHDVAIEQIGHLIAEGPSNPQVPAHQPLVVTLKDDAALGSHPFKIRAVRGPSVGSPEFQAAAAADPEIIIT